MVGSTFPLIINFLFLFNIVSTVYWQYITDEIGFVSQKACQEGKKTLVITCLLYCKNVGMMFVEQG